MGCSRVARVLSGRKDRRYRLWSGVPCLNPVWFCFVKRLQNVAIGDRLLVVCLLTWSCDSFAKGNHKCDVKRRNVDRFLLDLYIGAAGMLPQKLLASCFKLNLSVHSIKSSEIGWTCEHAAKTLAYSTFEGSNEQLVFGLVPRIDQETPRRWLSTWMRIVLQSRNAKKKKKKTKAIVMLFVASQDDIW